MAEDSGSRAWGGLLKVHALVVPRIDAELRQSCQLPLAWYDLLLELWTAPDHRLRMSELSDRVTLSRTRVSRLVDELATAGLVERLADPADRRSAYAVLTSDGERRFRSAAPRYLRSIRTHFTDHLTPAQQHSLDEGLWGVYEAESRGT